MQTSKLIQIPTEDMLASPNYFFFTNTIKHILLEQGSAILKTHKIADNIDN